MLSQLKRLESRKTSCRRIKRHRSLSCNLEQLENRKLLAADLDFSTLYPSTSQADGIFAMDVDSNGGIYVSGWKDWDTSDPQINSFVAKRHQNGAVAWEQGVLPYANEMEVDENGLIYFFSRVEQSGLPVTPDAVKSDLSGTGGDYYLAILDSNQMDSDPTTLSNQELVYATYLGGSSDEHVTYRNGLVVDASGAVYVSGSTESVDFPTTGQASADQSFNGGSRDGLISKFSPASGNGGYELSYSTYWGGSGWDAVTDLAIDSSGVLHAAGHTGSSDLPVTADAYLSTVADSGNSTFLTRFDSNGDVLYSTYFGRASYTGIDIAVDEAGATYLAGRTGGSVSDFPVTATAFQKSISGGNGGYDAFLSKFDTSGQLEFSTLYGGAEEEGFYARVEVDNGQPILIGETSSADLPVKDALQAYGGAGIYASGDTFVARFNEDASELLFGTFLGGTGDDYPGQLILTGPGEVLIAGSSYMASGFPVTDDSIAQGESDGFLTKISFEDSSNTAPLLSVENTFVREGDAGISTAEFVFTLAAPHTAAITVDYSTFGQSATVGEDFTDVSGELEIAVGETVGVVSVPVQTDTVIENDETFILLLSNPLGVRLSQSSPVATIQNDDPGALDSFDGIVPNGGVGDWNTPWSLTSNSAFTNQSSPNDGSTHAIIQRRGSLTRQVHAAGITNLNLAFASKLRSFENSDRAYVQVSPDGSNWTTLKTFFNGEDDNTYRNYSYDIPFEAETLWIRFEGDMSSSTRDYWYVDSVRVTGTVASQPPVANDDSGSTDEDQSVTIDVLANDLDPEGDALSIASVTQPDSGSAAIVGGQVQYTPDPDFYGSDSFTYTIIDAADNSATATVNLTVAPVNDAPVSADDSVTTLEDTPATIDVLGNDADVDGDSLSVQSATDGSSGLVSVNSNNTLTYTPNAGFFGTDAFTYTITDGNGGTSTATVNVTVEKQNDPPTAVGDSATTNEDVSLLVNVLANDSDPDNDSLSIQSVTQPTSGTTAIEPGQVRYTPDSNFHGSDSFTYSIVDTAGNTATATVSILITPVNDAPVATDNGYSLDQDTTLTIDAPGVLSNDSDVDGDDLTASLVTGPASGSLTLSADGSFTYTPDAGFVGNDSFVYQAEDTAGAVSESVAVSLQVNAVVTGPNLAHGNVPVVGSSWQTVSLGKSYQSAVIVATPRYNNGSGPGVVRISNVTATSFDVRVDNVGTSAFDGGIHFIAMEEGVYDVPGEYKLEAVKVDASTTSRRSGWQISSQAFAQSYSSPVVVGQVMSSNDDWSVFWSSSSSRTSPASSGSLNVGKHVGEDADTTRATETLGYFVIEATSGGTIDGLNFAAGVGSDAIRGVGNGTYQYSGVNPSGATTAVLSGAGMDGNDGGWAVLRGTDPLASDSIQMSIDEDQIGDSERNHTTEQVAYFVIGESVGEGEASQLAAPEIRIHDPMDVNGDGFTSPIDALAVVNALNAEPGTGSEEGDMALDTNGDGYLSALDALLVVNRLNVNNLGPATSAAVASLADGYFADLGGDEESPFDLDLV